MGEVGAKQLTEISVGLARHPSILALEGNFAIIGTHWSICYAKV